MARYNISIDFDEIKVNSFLLKELKKGSQSQKKLTLNGHQFLDHQASESSLKHVLEAS
jgi:hypothetical protein